MTIRARDRNTFGAIAGDFMLDHARNLRTRAEMQRKLDVELPRSDSCRGET
jgi:hypothetical protein